MAAIRTCIAPFLLLAVAACGDETGPATDSGTLWGSESAKQRAEREAIEERLRNKQPVLAIRTVEVGRDYRIQPQFRI